jgi:hypothetical protein
MNANTNSVAGDSADFDSLNAMLASASWDVDMLVTPSCEPSSPDATDSEGV